MIKHVKKYLIAHEGNSYKPHLLREKSLTAISVLIFVLFCTSLGSSYLVTKTDFGAAVLPSVLVDLTNEHRIANNGKALAINPKLELAAYMKAKDMAENQYFAHTSPAGVTPWQWFSKADYRFVYAGENLAINFTESSDVERAWIASPTHQANLINEKFDETGIATYQGTYQGQPTIFVVQLFGKRAKPRPVAVLEKSELPSTKEPIKLAQGSIKTPEVKGESAAVVEQAAVDPQEPAPILLVNEPTFSVVQNLNEVEPPKESDLTVGKYSNLAKRLLVNQSKYVQYIYLGLIIFIYFVLIGMIVVEFKVQHIKNISLSILLLCLLGVLAYINSSFVLSFV